MPVKRLAQLLLLTIACVGLVLPVRGQSPQPPVKIVVLGDSLSAGFGLPGQAAFPARLGEALRRKGIAATVINAGVSGDTASGGLERLDWSVPDGTDAVILELGANDMLRGVEPAVTRKALDWSVPDGADAVILELGANDMLRGVEPAVTRKALDTILRRLSARKIAVLLCGMRAPPNMGATYVRAFDAIYPTLASTHGVVFYPFFLEGVAADRALNQPDGLHPTAAGIDAIVARILPKVEELIGRVKK